jgi:hypothetical protein
MTKLRILEILQFFPKMLPIPCVFLFYSNKKNQKVGPRIAIDVAVYLAN